MRRRQRYYVHPNDPAYDGPSDIFDCTFCFSRDSGGICSRKGREVEDNEAEDCEDYEFDIDRYDDFYTPDYDDD